MVVAAAVLRIVEPKRVALCIQDLGTGCVDVIPLADRLATTTQWALDQFYSKAPSCHIYSDGASEFAKVARGLFIPHSTSIPGAS